MLRRGLSSFGSPPTFSRREFPAATPDWVNIDHRRGISFAPGELPAYLRATWDLTPHAALHIEGVHRLDDLGAVVTLVAHGTSAEGFDADWRLIELVTVEGDKISRCELFDEADLDAALARFDELSRQGPRLANAASRSWSGIIDALNLRDKDGVIASITGNGRLDDRRRGLRVVMEGTERQRAFRELVTVPDSWRLETEPVAIRGSRLALTYEISRDTDEADRPITVELLTVIEVGERGLVRDTVSFDPDDIDAAFAELDARYLAGEAAAYAHTWSAIVAAQRPHSIGTNSPRPHRTASLSTIDRSSLSRRATCLHRYLTCGIRRRTSGLISPLCIG